MYNEIKIRCLPVPLRSVAFSLDASGTPKAHAERQLKMLLIASKLLRKNGILLYTTCSLSHSENESVRFYTAVSNGGLTRQMS